MIPCELGGGLHALLLPGTSVGRQVELRRPPVAPSVQRDLAPVNNPLSMYESKDSTPMVMNAAAARTLAERRRCANKSQNKKASSNIDKTPRCKLACRSTQPKPDPVRRTGFHLVTQRTSMKREKQPQP
ncbi:uncharacterized protein IWZ02DRAFT_428836 [Phyllosticta citriasiana]|uniref:uncharacterized protein n=1 Tax=Phyllosticta citriasiana TaxID=595635 RepID=UPI0030FD9D96